MKKRSRAYLKTLKSKAVKYYFENPDSNLKWLSNKFNINEAMLSTAISKELKKRFQNSLSRKCARI
jgi:hypothetical protein